MSKKKVTSAPRSCSARGRESRKAEAERSKSPFRATAPALLQRELSIRVDEERRRANGLFMADDVEHKRRACAFHLGKAAALEELGKWLGTSDGKRALARNNKSSDLR